jgi:hypothetical protein
VPLPLTSKEVADRLRDYSRENYLLLANVIKGVVLASATVTAIHVLTDLPHNWQKITAFACSGAAAFISYITWTRGVLLSNSRSNTRDVVLTFVMGGSEVLLFSFLCTDCGFPAPWHFWFFVLAAHSGLAVLLVKNRIRNTRPDDFDQELLELVHDDFVHWMKDDILGASIGTGISVLAGCLICLFWWKAGQRIFFIPIGQHLGNWAFLVLPLLPFSALISHTKRVTRQLWELDEKVSQALRGG